MNSTATLPAPTLPPESNGSHHGIDIALLAILMVIPLGLFALFMIFRSCLVNKHHDMKAVKLQKKERKRAQREIQLQYEHYP
jgi:hypothetical protein